MAHNYYRIPVRIRMTALHEMKNSEAEVLERSRCRRHRRKLRFLLNQFELRQKIHGSWMETHIWHAKRFKMESKWGTKYPVRCSDKSDRSTYRLVQRESACIMDRSYFSTFIIAKESVKAFSSAVDQKHILNNLPEIKRAEINLYDGEKMICPVEIIYLPDESILVQVHPSATS